MSRMDKEIFVCLDCETTGLDPIQDRIIEVGLISFTLQETINQYESLIEPDCAISETSMKITHITHEMVKGKPKIQDVLPKIIELIGRHTIVGHGIEFDVQLLINAAERANIPHNLKVNKTLDTLRMARLYGESPVNSLERLRQHFNIEAEGAHRAMSDVIVNIEVFKQLARNYKTTEDLFEALSRPIMMKIMPLGKHKGRALKEIPLDYLMWASHKDFDKDLLFSLRTEIKRRKKGNLFTQAGNPFADL